MSAPSPITPAPRRRRQGLPLGTLAGIPLYVSPTWLIIAAILTVEYGRVANQWSDALIGTRAYAVAALFAVLFAASILAHELGHAFAALAFGLHVDSVVIYLLGGVSEIEESSRPRDEVLVAAAGPAVSAALALGAYALSQALEPNSATWVLAVWLVWGNAMVAVFNLLPGLPLDGGRVLQAGLWATTRSRYASTIVAAWAGRALGIALMVGELALQALSGASTLISLPIALYLAFFLWVSAGQALAHARRERRLGGLRVADMARPVVCVSPSSTLQEALERAQAAKAAAIVVRDEFGRALGLVDHVLVNAVPQAQWPWLLVTQAMAPLGEGTSVPDSIDGAGLVGAFRRHPAPAYLVVGAGGEPIGVVLVHDIAAAVQDQPSY